MSLFQALTPAGCSSVILWALTGIGTQSLHSRTFSQSCSLGLSTLHLISMVLDGVTVVQKNHILVQKG